MPQREGRAVAVIPARGGSQGIPGKNVARVGGVPLVARAVHAAQAAACFDGIYVSTDDPTIAAVAKDAGAHIIDRPANLAGHTATSETAVLHALRAIEERDGAVQVVAFLQATSPFQRADALAAAVSRVQAGSDDSVFSAYATHGFLWRMTDVGATGINHDHTFRPRRQDREPQFQESGAFYVMDAAGFASAGHRFFGRIGIQEVPAATGLEIDEPAELTAAQLLATFHPHASIGPIKALAMDFDGVHTDDRVHVLQDGSESVTVSRSDGMGLAMLRDAGLPMIIISKERNPVVHARGTKLGIETVNATDNKVNVLRQWSEHHGISLSDVAFVGNDVNDVAGMEAVGWPIAVPDAHPAALAAARVRLTRPGGNGALRELAHMILDSKEPHHG